MVSAARKKKSNQKKKDRWCKFSALYRTKSAKKHGRLFSKFVKQILKTVSFVLVRLVEILSLSYPLTRPKSTVGFLKTPKGDFQTAVHFVKPYLCDFSLHLTSRLFASGGSPPCRRLPAGCSRPDYIQVRSLLPSLHILGINS